jgi:DNA-binding CsgD family transcriptional regulator
MLTRTVGDTNILRSITRQRILFAIRDGDLDAARQWQSTLSEAESASYPFYASFIRGKFLLAKKEYRQAQVSFDQTLKTLNGRDLAALRIETLIGLGICAKAQNQKTKATRLIGDAIKLAESGGIVRPFVEMRPEIAALLPGSSQSKFARMLDRADRNGAQANGPDLTRREKEILQLLSVGMSNQEMAETLVIAEGTLKRHVANLYQKLGVHSRLQAIRQMDHLK